MPSCPTSASAGTTTSSKNTSVVLWFIIVGIGRMVMPVASRRSTRNTDMPSVFFATSS